MRGRECVREIQLGSCYLIFFYPSGKFENAHYRRQRSLCSEDHEDATTGLFIHHAALINPHVSFHLLLIQCSIVLTEDNTEGGNGYAWRYKPPRRSHPSTDYSQLSKNTEAINVRTSHTLPGGTPKVCKNPPQSYTITAGKGQN